MLAVVRVLVVDDEEGMRLGVARALRNFKSNYHDLDMQASYDITIAASGEEAIEKVEQNEFELILLDYKLPGLNGIEVLSKVKTLQPETHVVMMTAYASLNTAVTATKKGAFDFLAKPFTPEELRSTVRKATESLLLYKQAKQMSEEKRRVRFEFISVLSHELKAPIAAVEGYLDLFKNGLVKDEQTQDRVVNRSLKRLAGMRKLIYDLLDLTRIEAGTKTRELNETDITSVVENAVELVEELASQKEVAITFENTGPVMFWCDRDEMEIVLNNLVSNAVKYNKDKGTVHIVVEKCSDVLTIKVKDTGIGLSQAEQDKLFGEFVRIKNRKTRGIPGSGLGLSTVKKIAQLYGGDVWVESDDNVGSTFFVSLAHGDGDKIDNN